MKKQTIIFAFSFIVLGLLTALAPFTFAGVCETGEKIMKCHWTARAELFTGIVIALLGAAKFILSCRNYQLGINLAVALNSIGVILFPTALIGVCGMAKMHCHSVTRPALIVLAVVLLLADAVHSALIIKSKISEKK